MKPMEIGRLYDAIASWWDEKQDGSATGLVFIRRIIHLATNRRKALDVGCGCGGRVIATLSGAGYQVVGIDVSAVMLQLARSRHPDSHFIHADICEWLPSEQYDVIIAWDSIFHTPYDKQRRVVGKLCGALAPGGAILFTAGGIDGEVTGEMYGRTFYYASLSEEEYLQVLRERGCKYILLERDQHPEEHLVVLVLGFSRSSG